MVVERIKRLREQLERRQKATKAKSRARERSRTRGAKAREKAEKERRIKQGNPESLQEKVAVARNEAKGAVSAGKGAVSAERRFLAQELGVSTSEAGAIAREGNKLFDSISAGGGSLDALDLDGDGDTDILTQLDKPLPMEQDDGLAFDPTEPVVDFSGTTEAPLFNDNIGTTLDTDAPSPGEIPPRR